MRGPNRLETGFVMPKKPAERRADPNSPLVVFQHGRGSGAGNLGLKFAKILELAILLDLEDSEACAKPHAAPPRAGQPRGQRIEAPDGLKGVIAKQTRLPAFGKPDPPLIVGSEGTHVRARREAVSLGKHTRLVSFDAIDRSATIGCQK